MTIKIVTDSSCDLPAEIIKQYDITVVPLYIIIGDQSYLDNVELTREEFFDHLPEYRPYPTTATPSPEKFREIYERLADEGATEIISIHISKNISAIYNAASLGAKEFTRVPVTVIDSEQLSLGFGFIVWLVARYAREGLSIQEIRSQLENVIPKTFVFATLDSLEFLRRSGRMNSALAGIGSLLQIKPVLKMYAGHPASELVRTWNGALNRIANLVEQLGPLKQVAFIQSNATEKVEQLRQRLAHLLPESNILVVTINPVLGTHVGPGGVGIACIKA